MSVLACNRNGCDRIMCERYLPTFGYLCNDCFEEFKKLCSKEKYRLLVEFMKSAKEPALDDFDLLEDI
jgi:hypothetical protein